MHHDQLLVGLVEGSPSLHDAAARGWFRLTTAVDAVAAEGRAHARARAPTDMTRSRVERLPSCVEAATARIRGMPRRPAPAWQPRGDVPSGTRPRGYGVAMRRPVKAPFCEFHERGRDVRPPSPVCYSQSCWGKPSCIVESGESWCCNFHFCLEGTTPYRSHQQRRGIGSRQPKTLRRPRGRQPTGGRAVV